jgi:DNA polymerase I-like protein with 3'-5' exonuclease and polymerase domains
VRQNGPPIIGQFHDEWIAVIRRGNEKKLEEHVKKAIKATNEELGLNRELSVELHFGTNYGDIH